MKSNNPDTSGMFETTPSVGSIPSYVDKPQSSQDQQNNPNINNTNEIGAPLPMPNLPPSSLSPGNPQPQMMEYNPNPQYQLQIQPPYPPQAQPVLMQPPVQVVPPLSSNLTTPLIGAEMPNDKTTFDIVECLQDIRDASVADINKVMSPFNCCESCVILPEYHITITNRKDSQTRKIFIGKQIAESCCESGKMFIRMKYIPRDTSQNYLTVNNFELRLFDILGGMRINNCCEQKPTTSVRYTYNQQLMGEIFQPNKCNCCCTDPIYEIKSNSGIKRYIVTTDGTQCAYCCCDGCCCTFNAVTFPVLNSIGSQLVGEIFKNVFQPHRINLTQNDKNSLHWRVTFPNDSFPEDKIILIATAILIDYQNYFSLANRQ